MKRREEKKREDAGAPKARKKSRNTVFFGAQEGRQVGFLKRRVLSQIARRCGAKYISKSKYAKHLLFGTLLEVEMPKQCKPLKSTCENFPGKRPQTVWAVGG